MNVLLLSTYERGHQPLNLARPAAHLAAGGHHVHCQDLAVEPFDPALVRDAHLVGLSVPMHTATRLGARLAERVRAINPAAHLTHYGLYAALHAEVLLDSAMADSVIGGEFETPLADLAAALAASVCGRPSPRHLAAALRDQFDVPPGVQARHASGGVFLGRQASLLPRRDLLPPLARYARVDTGAARKLVGYVEASRGCAHTCLHCPITPVYGGRLRVVAEDIVLADIRQLVALGAEHVTFGDPDFFNGIRHSLRVVEALHAEFPHVTFDATIKIEHLLEHRAYLPTLQAAGCLFIVSAVEAIHDRVLGNLRKGHTGADVEIALALTGEVGIPLRPTFVPFTPWTSLDDYVELLDWIAALGLVRHVDPVQLAIRLLVPQGSSLIGTKAMAPFLGPFDPTIFAHPWTHPDPRMDRLQREVASVVERAACTGEDAPTVFARVHALAATAAGRPPRVDRPPACPAPRAVPHLTEPWFC